MAAFSTLVVVLIINFQSVVSNRGFVSTDEGEVFVWGFGILGKGPNLSETSTPEKLPQTLFGQSEFNPDVRVTRIRCGLNHFAAITSMLLHSVISVNDCVGFTSVCSVTCNVLFL